MTTVREAAEALETALRTVPGVRVYRDPGANIDPPAAIVGPPALGWRGFCGSAPVSARFSIWLTSPADDRTLERLWELVPAVAAVLDQVENATLADLELQATPGQFPTSGGVTLPAYEIQVDVSL